MPPAAEALPAVSGRASVAEEPVVYPVKRCLSAGRVPPVTFNQRRPVQGRG
ncbi:hypothetical protein ACFFX0_31585 [Citricoccus parietis]|uniref:Uncharacterized protein n=1 Tax=Citricoccus parietis TaxID=592307 RepID=A0ABV5G933_9MICC